MKKLTVLLLVAALGLPSCNSLTIGHGDEPPSYSRNYTMHNWVWGIFGDQLEVQPREYVKVYRGPIDILVSIATLGLWIPWSAEVWSVND